MEKRLIMSQEDHLKECAREKVDIQKDSVRSEESAVNLFEHLASDIEKFLIEMQ
jgi:hypothetical protein